MMKSVLLRNHCGCLVTRTSNHPLVELEQIEYCPKHAAAPYLYKVAEQVEHVGRLADDPTCPDEFLIAEVKVLRDKAKAAIALAKKPEEEKGR